MRPRVSTIAAARYWLRAALAFLAVVACLVALQRFVLLATGGSTSLAVRVNPATGNYNNLPTWAWDYNLNKFVYAGVLDNVWLLVLAGALLAVRRWLVPWVLPITRRTCPSCQYPVGEGGGTCPECGLELDVLGGVHTKADNA